jgi:hypothetical protein
MQQKWISGVKTGHPHKILTVTSIKKDHGEMWKQRTNTAIQELWMHSTVRKWCNKLGA